MKNKFLFIVALAAAVSLSSCGGDNPAEPDPVPGPNPDPIENILDIPDIAGKNIKGVVYCGKEPVANVVVTDGIEVTKTDEKGRYYLNSTKKSGSVSVCAPSGYNVDIIGNLPMSYKRLSDSGVSVIEQHNFELKKNGKDNYVVICLADVQIGGLYNAGQQFVTNFLPDVNKQIQSYRSAGKDVYVFTLGDQSHDLYWYSHDIDLLKAMLYIMKVDAPVFNIMGNHDNDPYCAGDYAAERKWREINGPKNYSLNIGDIHYVMLDNIVYENEGATEGSIGPRDYKVEVTSEQIQWLKKDLSYITDKTTPVVVCMHAPSFEKAKMYNDEATPRIRHNADFYERAKFIEAFSGFTNVTFLTGHTHTNYCNKEGNIREYNVGAVNGSLWRSSAPGNSENNVCVDGSPAGYLILDVKNRSFVTTYKSAGYDIDYQFRSYDGNRSRIVKSKFFPNSSKTNAAAEKEIRNAITAGAVDLLDEWFTSEYRSDNMVFVNVFAWDDRWKIEMTEEGKSLKVTQINALDPYHLISLGCKMIDNNEKLTNGPLPSLTAHFFKAQASSATSTVTIKVTDPYGRVYTEEMVRPKQLALDMK